MSSPFSSLKNQTTLKNEQNNINNNYYIISKYLDYGSSWVLFGSGSDLTDKTGLHPRNKTDPDPTNFFLL